MYKQLGKFDGLLLSINVDETVGASLGVDVGNGVGLPWV